MTRPIITFIGYAAFVAALYYGMDAVMIAIARGAR